MKKLLLALACSAGVLLSQGNTALLRGSITDPSGAPAPGAAVAATNVQTKLAARTVTNERGEYALPSMPSGVYEITASKNGFKVARKSDIEIAAGVDTTVNVRLEIGDVTESVTVAAGAEMAQSTSAGISSTLAGRQIGALPTSSRDALELFNMLPGAATPNNYRSTFINGMAQEAINITIDGINTNDNWNKSATGFLSYIMPSIDSVEEATLSTSAAGVDATSQGGAQLKFTTRSGNNQFHGGVFWQHRNTVLNANYYFNNINGLPRDIIRLNQGGFHVGGPIKKDKLLFFVNYEIYRLPMSFGYSQTVLPPAGQAGNFSYCPTSSTADACAANPSLLRTVNLFTLAQQANAKLPAGVRPYRTSPDPIIAQTLSQIWGLVSGGNLQNNQPGNDFNRDTYRYQESGPQRRDFFTARLDYNPTTRHHLSFTLKYDLWTATPDIADNIVPMYAGTGAVLGSSAVDGLHSDRFAGTLALRSTLSPRLTNELRIGATGGTSVDADATAPAMFAPWRGYAPDFGYISGVNNGYYPLWRNNPVKDLAETLSWVKGTHELRLGGNWQSVATYERFISAESIPWIYFGMATGDPATTGSSAWLTTANFPGISSGDLGSAGTMYAMLAGRVSWIQQGVTENEKTHQYGHTPYVDRNRQREMGLFLQDIWRIRPDLTLTLGARLEKQFPFTNLSGMYSDVGYEGLWGISGVGNLFKPGTLTGVAPAFQSGLGHEFYNSPLQVLPSAGLAYQLPARDGFWKIFTGSHSGAAVLRAGYSIAGTRGGGNNFQWMAGVNAGPFYDTSVDPSINPEYFGPPGSVYFSDPTLPTRPNPSAPQYPLAPGFSDVLNGFDPHLRMGYVQSWNISYQRELGRDTVVEIRYTGNHGVHLWQQFDLNEVNIFENGFLADAMIAQQNLAIANGVSVQQLPYLATLKSANFGNQGLAGQQNFKILKIALGGACCADRSSATNLAQSKFGLLASTIANNVTRMANLASNGYPANFFVVNPAVGDGTWGPGGSFLMTNQGASYYDAGQVELRRRLAAGLEAQGSYVWSHALVDGPYNDAGSWAQPTTLRNLRLDRGPGPYDLRHAFKASWVCQFPFGTGRRLLSASSSRFARKAIEGWEIAGTTRIQAGAPSKLAGNSNCINNGDNCGVVLHNITPAQLQSLAGVYKTTGSNGIGIVYDLPLDLIHNSEAAFNQGGFKLDPNAPYIAPSTAPGQLGYSYYLRGPWQSHLDVSLIKRTRLGEKANVEARAQALNVLNLINFYPANTNVNSAGFGQISGSYRNMIADDPGGRVLEFVLRINF